MQKRGRPKAAEETEQVAVRLPKSMVAQLRPNVSKEIRERLAQTLFDDERDPNLRKIAGQIEEIANDVRHATGSEWHADESSHHIFIGALKLLFADLKVPKAKSSAVKMDPIAAARLLYNRYAENARELEQRDRPIKMKPRLRRQLEGDND